MIGYQRMFPWVAALLLLVGCQAATPPATPPPTPTLTPRPPTTLTGQLTPLTGTEEVGGRGIALCAAQTGQVSFPLTCTVSGVVGRTAPDGGFSFSNVTPARYILLIETGLGDFDAAIGALRGQTFVAGDWGWAQERLFDGAQTVPLNLPALPPGVTLTPADYALNTLQLGSSPVMVGHYIGAAGEASTLRPAFADLTRSSAPFEIPITQPQPPDRDAIREGLGPLSEAEAAALSVGVRERWAAFIDGDDAAFRDTDARLISGLREGVLYPIGATVMDTQEAVDGRLVKRVVYVASVDGIVAWEDGTGVTEAGTGYRLNVLDAPGEWTTEGPQGEQVYHYGWSYFRRWGRVLPDPVIAMVNDFYNRAPGHVQNFAVDYQMALESFGGDMTLITWGEDLPRRITSFEPQTARAPTLTLPDSGTVDIRRERFFEAITTGQVVVAEESVEGFLTTAMAQNNPYVNVLTEQVVTEALLVPYRSGTLYNDMEAAIILEATYGSEGPLVVEINNRLRAGYQVPRRTDNLVRVSPAEVANVILGYGGALNAKWPHEMAHIVEFRSPLYEFQRQQDGISACEPLKYMLEFMWWVERYPYDAPATDWMPIGSGLTLARLLTDTYPNSGC